MTEDRFRKELSIINNQREYFKECLKNGFIMEHIGEDGDKMLFKERVYEHQDFFQDMDILDRDEKHLREFYKNHKE